MSAGETIISRFADIATQHCGQPALSTATEAWSYEELDRRSDAIASLIRGQDAGPRKVVGLMAHHGPALIAAILGVLKSGHAYASLDPTDLPERRRAAWRTAGGRLVLADQENFNDARKVAEGSSTVIRIDDPAPEPNISVMPEAQPESPAWLMFTSGSTGEPKAVWQTHAAVLHHTRVYAELIQLQPGDRLSLLTPCHLAASASALFGALLNGATLCPFALRTQGTGRLASWLSEQRISIWHTVPSVFRQTLRNLPATHSFPHLRIVRLGGEPVLPADVELLRRHCPPSTRLLHAYSSTETGLVCAKLIGSMASLSGMRVPVGRPVPGVKLELVDDAGEVAGAGETGRIAVTSRHLSPGYWLGDQSPPTAGGAVTGSECSRRFVTADLGQFNAAGELECLGRVDSLAKVRGQRVDIALVEAGLGSLSGVIEAVATVVTDPAGTDRLVAHVVTQRGSDLSALSMRRHLIGRVSPVLIPDQIVLADQLPHTAGGKVDRRALPAPPWPTEQRRVKATARDWFEKRVAEIWESVLGIRPVGRFEDFFELGGSSVESARVLAGIEDEFAVALPPSTLLEHGTVEKLGRLLAGRTIQCTGNPLVCLRREGAQPPLFLVHGGKGDVAMFGQLARRITHRPVYAFQSKGLSGECWPLTSIERMVEAYLHELTRVAPDGPIFLVGTCMGGLTALEMGRRLSQRSRVVARLVLIDTDHPRSRPTTWPRRLLHSIRDGTRIARWALLRKLTGEMRAAQLPEYRRFVHAMNSRARRMCRPACFPGRVDLLLGGVGEVEPDDARLKMRQHAGTAEVRLIPGERARLFLPPAVDLLAKELNQMLTEGRTSEP